MYRRLVAFFIAICLSFSINIGVADTENDWKSVLIEAAARAGKMKIDASYKCTFDGFVRGVEYEIIRTEETDCGMNFYVNFFYVDFYPTGNEWHILQKYAAPYMIICSYEDNKLIIDDVLDAWAAGDLFGIDEYESILENVFANNYNSYPGLAQKWWNVVIDNMGKEMNETCESQDIILLPMKVKYDE